MEICLVRVNSPFCLSITNGRSSFKPTSATLWSPFMAICVYLQYQLLCICSVYTNTKKNAITLVRAGGTRYMVWWLVGVRWAAARKSLRTILLIESRKRPRWTEPGSYNTPKGQQRTKRKSRAWNQMVITFAHSIPSHDCGYVDFKGSAVLCLDHSAIEMKGSRLWKVVIGKLCLAHQE